MLRQKRTVWENIKKSSLEKYRDALRYAKKEHIKIKRLLKKEKRVFSRKIWWRICFIEKKIEITKGKCKKYERRLERKLEKKTKRKVKEFIVFIKRYLKNIKRENQKQFLKYKRKILKKKKLFYKLLFNSFNNLSLLITIQLDQVIKTLVFISDSILLNLVSLRDTLNLILGKQTRKVLLRYRCEYKKILRRYGREYRKYEGKLLKKSKKILLKNKSLTLRFVRKKVKIIERQFKKYERKLEQKKIKTEQKAEIYIALFEASYKEFRKENRKKFLKYKRGLNRIISKKRKEIVIGIIRLFLDVFYYRNLFVEIINDEKELFRKLLDSIGEKLLKFFDFVEWYQREFRCFVISNGSYFQKFKSWFTKITQPSFVFLKTTSFPRIKIAKIVKNSSGNFLIVWLIFLLVVGWVFSGWPRI